MILIDKQDNFEIIRDQIAAILVTEVANQKTLATNAGKDPALWDMRVFLERTNPLDILDKRAGSNYKTPLVIISFRSSDVIAAGSNVEQQKYTCLYDIDIYGRGIDSNSTPSGHTAGDKEAAVICHRGIRLVRNILMHVDNRYLQARGVIAERIINKIEVFNKFETQQAQHTQNVIGSRVQLSVDMIETTVQNTPSTLEYLSTTVCRSEDDEVVLQADFDYQN